MTATIKFQTRLQAENFATVYSRATSGGHTIDGNNVKVYNVETGTKDFIDRYVKNINYILNN